MKAKGNGVGEREMPEQFTSSKPTAIPRRRVTRILASMAIGGFLLAAILQLGLPGVGFEATLVLTGVALWAGVLFALAAVVSWAVPSKGHR